jgi:hypothetical protein
MGSVLVRVSKVLADATEVRVGFLEGSTEADGTSIPMVAAIQEFGARIEREPGETTIYRSVKKNGEFAKNGKFVKRNKSNFASTHYVGAYVITIPPRPFFRTMIVAKSPGWGKTLGKLLIDGRYSARKALDGMGKVIGDQLQESIRAWTDPPNAPSTIAKKGFNKPLIDSSDMVKSVDHEVT